jgi:hypothetical protein
MTPMPGLPVEHSPVDAARFCRGTNLFRGFRR